MFPDGFFDENNDLECIYRELYTERLVMFGEHALTPSESIKEQYRFFTSELFCGIVRIEIESNQTRLVIKHLSTEIDFHRQPLTEAVQERTRPLTGRELQQFRKLVERSRFWEFPSWGGLSGLDGYRCVFEAQVGERYHLVERWVPRGDGFARLCDFCISLYRAEIRPRRWWWFW